ncbi:DUF3558 domain-containing protein [Pseudonocardia sp. CA-107938]|uniref:DUF3558 domain-containing protein n=1 Tax=Pseudonocardia sp. CA-107938 TaxID=3240021 RepID=UPI003D8AADF0
MGKDMRRAPFMGAITAALIVTGCSAGVAGSPAPSNPPVTPGPPAAEPAMPGTRSIDMTTFDFCTAISPAQAQSLEVKGPRPGTSPSGTRSCVWTHYLSEPVGSYLVSGGNIGIDAMNAVGGEFMVGRYRAVIARSSITDFEKECSILLDVRPGQSLQVSFTYSGSQRMTHDLACQKARPVAEMVVQNLGP